MKHSVLILMLAVLAACTESGLPRSGGRAYEVLITGKDAAANEALASQLRALMVEGLPQQEPMFEVSTFTADGLTQSTRYARNLIVVTTGDTARLQYERNAFAEPQMLISITMPEGARQYHVGKIAELLTRAELNNGIASLKQKHNAQAEALVREQFGYRLWVPADLDKMKRGSDFLWLSNGAAQGMQNICVFRYAASTLDEQQLLTKADSLLKANIPGEREGMWMQLAQSTARTADDRLQMRGLWEMQGDAMGGPYVSHSLLRGDSVTTAMAFVYAPEQKKRNLMRRLEAALYTIK